jgi:hypothetical protein
MSVYLLAYIREFGCGESFHLAIENDPSIGHAYQELASQVNISMIRFSEIKDREYDKLIVHSFFKFSKQKNFLSQIKFNSLSYFSDGFRNGFLSPSAQDPRLNRLIFFGIKLLEQSFLTGIPSALHQFEAQVVSFDSIKSTWEELFKLSNVKIEPKFERGDLILVMRYWGARGPHYEFNPGVSVLDYLREEFKGRKNIKRIIYRGHPWLNDDFEISQLGEIIEGGVPVVAWENLVGTDKNFPELCEPEAVMWRFPDFLGSFFGFDSSLNLIVNLCWPNAEIFWPQQTLYSKYFQLQRSSNLVTEQISWMQDFNALDVKHKSARPTVSIEGYAIQGILNTISILESDLLIQERDALTQERDARTQERDALTQERDALTQERDALTQERDALTQERDALTQERDALINSTIWRATRFIRALLSLARRTMRRST